MKRLFLFSFLILALALVQVRLWLNEPGNLSGPVNVVIHKGAGSGIVARKLAENGVISRPWLFRFAARLKGLDKRLKAGEYQFANGISLSGVIRQIARGEVFFRKLTLPEGLTTAQMLEIIRSEPALEGNVTIAPGEGTLLPETYKFIRGDSRDSVIRQAMVAMEKVKTEAWKNRSGNLPLKNAEEMMVLASIIEKETGIAAERRLVSSVFVNRLQKGMRLQTDPTVIYALTRGKKDLERLLTRKDLEFDSPYNTYKYYGLPPGPICNPGKASIEAAAQPEVSDYLYFVADGSGGHNFAVSLKEHNSNVRSWRKSRQR